jgi:hypothetical protein
MGGPIPGISFPSNSVILPFVSDALLVIINVSPFLFDKWFNTPTLWAG